MTDDNEKENNTVNDELLQQVPTYKDVQEASEILKGVSHVTPVHSSRYLNEHLQLNVFFKCEHFQRMGAFKFRGAYNALYHYAKRQQEQEGERRQGNDDDEEEEDEEEDDDDNSDRKSNKTCRTGDNRHHVVTFSSGNHAQAVALSAQLLGLQATIIMPSDAPQSKVEATRQTYGGKVIFYNRYTQDRNEIAQQLFLKYQKQAGNSGTTSCIFVPPYNHKHVIAGQGTVAKELLEELLLANRTNDTAKTDDSDNPTSNPCETSMSTCTAEKESSTTSAPSSVLDYLFVCVGGGGLISGSCLAVDALDPNCKVIGVEPQDGNDAQQSLEAGHIVSLAPKVPDTIADGAQTQQLGSLTFEVMKRHVHEIVTVSDEELIQGMRFFAERCKWVVEPTGCLGLAGLCKLAKQGKIPKGSQCGVIVSGGNVDLPRYCQLLSSTSPSSLSSLSLSSHGETKQNEAQKSEMT